MLCPGLLRWALLLALGLCRVHRARSRNVLLILGECAPADAPPRGALPFTATCCRSQRRLLAPPQHRSVLTPGFPEAPLLFPTRLPSWEPPWRGRQGGPAIQHPAPAAGSDPAPPSVPRGPANHVGPPAREAGHFPELRGPQSPEGMPEERQAGAQVPRGQPECPGALISSLAVLQTPQSSVGQPFSPEPHPVPDTPSSSSALPFTGLLTPVTSQAVTRQPGSFLF